MLPLIDVFTANDEVAMMHFRLRLHAPIATRTIILESNLTHTGQPKPLYMRNALTVDEIKRHAITLVNVPFTEDEYRRGNCSSSRAGRCTWVFEAAQRRYVNHLLQQIVDDVSQTSGAGDALVHVSDLDELLDVEALATERIADCVSPTLRSFVYGERCPATYPAWARSVLFRIGSGWLNRTINIQGPARFQLRKQARACPPSKKWLGWHFGNFMDTPHIVNKLNSFAHKYDGFIQQMLKDKDIEAAVERRVRNCIDVRGRK
ncbi:hypothetical protein AB1Y20_006280 [Prymnesium parvum]|uniref:Uncharacterized protein n=1 Tax=Prymnesium parvum TaxID=97485 RepID=A0AB34J265_PRYPA